ncbi:MAG: DUF2178 domain-containing protein, partial [Halonotius sp.]
MSDTLRPTIETVAGTPRRYKRVVYSIFAVGIAGLFVGSFVDRPLAGTTIYLLGAWIGSALSAGLPRVSDATLTDERDIAAHRHASGLTIKIVATVGIGVVPALYALEAADVLMITATMWGAIWMGSA